MQSSDSQSLAEAHSLSRLSAAVGLRPVPPGALAGYLQAQQAWRRMHVNNKAKEQSCSKMKSASQLQTVLSAGSHSSCKTSCKVFGSNSSKGLPILGCKAVAKMFEQRHEFLTRHRHEMQTGKQSRVKTCSTDTAASLLSLPEDVLLHIVYNLNHEDIGPLFQVCQDLHSMRQVEDVHHQRAMGKKRPAPRALPALRTTTRVQPKIAAPRALQFHDSLEAQLCETTC